MGTCRRWLGLMLLVVVAASSGAVALPAAAAPPPSLPVQADSAPAVATIGGSENLIVVRTKDNRIFYRIWKEFGFFPGEDTVGWREVPGGGRTPFAPAAARSSNGKVYVAVVGEAGQGMWVQSFDRVTKAWSGSWSLLGGNFSAGPELAADGGAANLTFLAPGLDGRIYFRLWHANVGYDASWRVIPTLTTSREVAARWITVSNPWNPYELVVVARGNDARIYTTKGLGTLNGSFQWDAWSQIPGGGLTDHGPAMEEFPTGQGYDGVTVMVRGTANGIFYQTMLQGVWNAIWRGLDDVGKTSFSPAIFLNGTPTVYITGPDRAVYQQKVSVAYHPPGAPIDWRVWFPWELDPGWHPVKGSLVKPPATNPTPPPPPPPPTSTHQYFLYCASHYTGTGESGTHYFHNVYAWARTLGEAAPAAVAWAENHQPSGTTFSSVIGGSCSANYGFSAPVVYISGGPNG